MMNCRQAARLLSEAIDRPLTPGERLALRLHTLLCAGCRNYRRQIAFLRLACRRWGAGEETRRPPTD